MDDPKTLTLVRALLVSIGVFSEFCAAMNYEWFMGSREAWVLVKILGRRAARIFYVVLGLLLVGVGCRGFSLISDRANRNLGLRPNPAGNSFPVPCVFINGVRGTSPPSEFGTEFQGFVASFHSDALR
ncbi:MAG: immunity 17 family protein [Synergistaceae bacterium]|nr:immunity 17 family protein [Synergistaceae bacterium]